MKTLILILIGLLALLLIGCQDTDISKSQPISSPDNNIGGGCGVSPSQDTGRVVRIPIASEM